MSEGYVLKCPECSGSVFVQYGKADPFYPYGACQGCGAPHPFLPKKIRDSCKPV